MRRKHDSHDFKKILEASDSLGLEVNDEKCELFIVDSNNNGPLTENRETSSTSTMSFAALAPEARPPLPSGTAVRTR